MHHANMMRNVVAGLQEALQQEKSPAENAENVLEPIDNVANTATNKSQQIQ